MEIEFASREQQELMEYLTPKLTEEELQHVAFLLTQHNLENYTVGYTKRSIQNTDPFFNTRECIEILDQLDASDWSWGYVQEDLEQYLYTPPAYEEYLETLILEVFPKPIWINLHELNIDTEVIIENLVDILDQRDVYNLKETNNLAYSQRVFKEIHDCIRDDIVSECTPAQLIQLAKINNLKDDDIAATNKFLTDYYNLSNIEIAKLWGD